MGRYEAKNWYDVFPGCGRRDCSGDACAAFVGRAGFSGPVLCIPILISPVVSGTKRKFWK